MTPTLYCYLPFREATAICKLAAGEQKKKSKTVEVLKAIGLPTLGFAGGAGLGFGLGRAADKLHGKVFGHPIPVEYLRHALPAITGGLGLAYGLYRAHQQEDLRRALQGDSDKPPVRE